MDARVPVKNYKPRQSQSAGRTFNSRQAQMNLYDPTWEKYRLRYLHHNPTCYACGAKSTVVDHLRPHKGDEKLFRQLDNHIPLCTSCHNRVTALFDKKFAVGGSISSKIQWLGLRRYERGLTEKVKVLPYYAENLSRK